MAAKTWGKVAIIYSVSGGLRAKRAERERHDSWLDEAAG